MNADNNRDNNQVEKKKTCKYCNIEKKNTEFMPRRKICLLCKTKYNTDVYKKYRQTNEDKYKNKYYKYQKKSEEEKKTRGRKPKSTTQ